MKRVLSLILSFTILILLLPVGSANAAISSTEYAAKVQSFIQTPRWANGASWGSGMTQSYTYSDWSSSGCCAYCVDFAGYVYGSRRAWNDSAFTKVTDPTQIRSGDIVHFYYSNSKRTSQHWIVVLERDGNTLYTAEGNAYVNGNYSVVCITDEKYVISDGTLKNTWNKTETLYSFEIYHYNFSDGGSGSLSIPAPVLTVAPGDSGTNTVFTWDDSQADLSFVLKVWQGSSASGEPTYTQEKAWSGMGMVLPAGTYTARVDAVSSLGQTAGQTVNFTVAKGCEHGKLLTENGAAPTCTAEGSTGDTVCGDCGQVLDYGLPIPALGHTWQEDTCTVCGARLGDVFRIAGSNRFDTAFQAADQMKENLEIEKFDSIIVASGTGFADALAGSYLASVKSAPILLSFNEAYNEQVKAYIRENLNIGGTVYILGGESAVPASLETGLEGFDVKRLAGSDRFGTNLEILAEAGVEGKDVLVCTGLEFADSLSASAAGLPILLVWKELTAQQQEFLEEITGALYVIGGTGAVSEELLDQISIYGPTIRLGGSNRLETSVLIAETFFDDPEAAVMAYGWNYPDGLCGGALAATLDAPLILTTTGLEGAAMEYIQAQNITKGTILGGTGLISDASVKMIYSLSADAQIVVK